MNEAPLAALLPKKGEPPLSADAVLDRFVAYVSQTGVQLYPAQEEAILELLGDKHLVLATPTGSGKSLVALAFHFIQMAAGKRSFYTCPIKALVNEKFFALCEAFGAQNVGMMTGDAAINRDAPILCCTAEILSNLCLREDRQFVDGVVMDEFHYYGDKDRGVAWQVPLLMLEQTTFVLMSATLGDLTSIKESVSALTHQEFAEVRTQERPVPLDYEYAETPLHETVQRLLQSGRAPIYLVNFSQRAAAEQAQNILSIDFSTKGDKEQIKEALVGFRFDTPFGKDLKKYLLHGVGLHHAGLLPKYRRLVERLAQQGLLKVVSGTDTLGVGVNIPIRSVLFTQLCKYDGEKTAVLTVRDFQQIAGRAGRKGFDDRGSVVAQAPAHMIENLALARKKEAGKKVVMQKPPTRGYAHWDRATFERLRTGLPEALESRFTVTHGLIINLLQAGAETREGGYRRLVKLVQLSHSSGVIKGRLLKHARSLFRALLGAGIIIHEKRTPTRGAHLAIAEGLQREFSLHQTLSLYLVETLKRLDPVSENYPLDVLTLVESILESPDTVLYAQLDRLKGLKVAEMKAAGIEYDQRMEELEKLEAPKPNAEFIYGTFNDFAAKHPWVGQENIRPKSIARELFETCATFNDYIKDYGLQRSEGVLLRYLGDAYKTLEDVMAFLLTTLKQVDSSLLEEWLAMRDGVPMAPTVPTEERPKPKRDLAALPRELAARVRAEAHRFISLLARKNYEEAAELLAVQGGWTTERLEKEMEPFWAAHPVLDATPRARQPKLTQLTLEEPRVWNVRHTLLAPDAVATLALPEGAAPPELEDEWMLEGTVDLRGRLDPDEAIFDLRRIGT
jgi:superfamily II RNA helicase